MELAYWEVAEAAAWPCDEAAASYFVVGASCFEVVASLEACTEAAVALAVVLAYSVEDQAKQAAHASAWDDIDQQVVAAA